MKIRHAPHHPPLTGVQPRPAAKSAAHAAKSPAATDGFDVARRRPVDLSGAPGSEQVVKGLRELLTALQQVLSGLQDLQRTGGTTPAGGVTTPANATDSFRQLIAADIKTAYGREATDADYAYWLPKLQGPNDSGFVTGGQMSATEYWHRRMLGWQAGGSDMATSGPYAGSSDARGAVPSATDVVPSVPPSASAGPATSPGLEDTYRRLIAADIQLAGGRTATDADYDYWLPKLMGPCDSGFVTSGQMTGTEYWHRRMLGWQAGGADVAVGGPYAGGSERGPVPSVTDMVGPLPQ